MPVEMRPLLHEQAQAAEVRDDQIHAEVGPRAAAGQERQPNVEEWPAVERQHLVRHLFADRVKGCRRLRGGLLAQVEDRNLVARNVGQDSLLARGKDDRPQHVLARDQLLKRGRQALAIHAAPVELHVRVGGDLAQLDRAGAADPVRLLYVVQRKRLVPLLGPGRDARQRPVDGVGCALLQLPEQRLLVPGEQIGKIAGGHTSGRTHAKLIAIGPQLHALLRQPSHQLAHVRKLRTHNASSSISSPASPTAVARLASVNCSITRLASCARLVAPTNFCSGMSMPSSVPARLLSSMPMSESSPICASGCSGSSRSRGSMASTLRTCSCKNSTIRSRRIWTDASLSALSSRARFTGWSSRRSRWRTSPASSAKNGGTPPAANCPRTLSHVTGITAAWTALSRRSSPSARKPWSGSIHRNPCRAIRLRSRSSMRAAMPARAHGPQFTLSAGRP